jgi:hypothetical protein
MERRIPVGPVVAAAGAVLLIVSLFLDWYEDVTGFTVFEALDLVLAALAVAALVAIAADLGARVPGAGDSRRVPVIGAVALVIVAAQLLNDPPLVIGDGAPGHAVGIWLALGGAVLILAGGVVTGSRVSLAIDVRRREPPPSEAKPAGAAGRDSAGEGTEQP